MRISDWSSAVCSSALGGNGDLEPCRRAAPPPRAAHRPKHRIVACLRRIEPRHELRRDRERSRVACPEIEPDTAEAAVEPPQRMAEPEVVLRTDERRVGQECVSTWRYRWEPNQ